MEGGPWWTRVLVVHDPWTKPTEFSVKNNPKINYPRKFAKRALGFFIIKPQSPNFLEDLWFLKIFPNIPLATF
jgi:hypothetical protein